MRILYQFPLSHFCEKARWLLDYKELDYVAENVFPALAQLKFGHKQLPTLKDATHTISKTTQIAQYLDEHYPEHPLIRSHRTLRTEIYEIEAIANDLGDCIQHWIFSLLSEKQTLDILLGERGYLRRFEKLTKPVLQSFLKKPPTKEQIKALEAKIYQSIDRLNEKIVAKNGKYFVGDNLGLADISVCSMLAPLLNLADTPWESEHENTVFSEIKEYLNNKPLGQYVIRIYATERNARVDWRGI